MVNLNFLLDKRARWSAILVAVILCMWMVLIPQYQAYNQIQVA